MLGHGGTWTGCANNSKGLVEKDLTLKIANYLKEQLLQYYKVNVILTHNEINFPNNDPGDLAARAMIARNNNADLYVSLHINDNIDRNIQGANVFVTSRTELPKYKEGLTNLGNKILTNLNKLGIQNNGVINNKLCNDHEPRYQYYDGSQADYYADIRHAMKGDSIDGYGENFSNGSGIPTVLIEHCYMNNEHDVQFLDSEEDLKKLAKADGEAIIDYLKLKSKKEVEEEKNKNSKISYSTHIENVGWQNAVRDGEISGTTGKSLRLEGIKVKLENNEYDGEIIYQTHVENIGWQNEVKNGTIAGTTGKSLRLEAIRIKLTGTMAQKYDVYYRVHCQEFGWMGWTKNGEDAGSTGYGYRLEAIEIKLVPKNSKAPGNTDRPFAQNYINYSTHVENIGWQKYVKNDEIAGTTGKSLRLEAIKIGLENQKYDGNIEYRTHIQNIGWEKSFTKNGNMSGTSGRSLRLEAIQIKLTGTMAQKYDVYYRVHCQEFGWMGWAKNGQSAGTTGYSYRLEAIQICIIEKGKIAPGITTDCFKSK